MIQPCLQHTWAFTRDILNYLQLLWDLRSGAQQVSVEGII